MGRRGGPKRTKEQRQHDRTVEAKLYCEGRTLREIADHISAQRPYTISYSQVRHDMAAVMQEWKDERVGAMGDYITAELAKINHMECAAWREWERSREDKRRTSQRRTTGDAGGKDEAGIVTEGRLGDPRYLATVQWCIERRCKMLGLDAPERIEYSGTQRVALTNLTDEELADLERIASRAAVGPA